MTNLFNKTCNWCGAIVDNYYEITAYDDNRPLKPRYMCCECAIHGERLQ